VKRQGLVTVDSIGLTCKRLLLAQVQSFCKQERDTQGYHKRLVATPSGSVLINPGGWIKQIVVIQAAVICF